MSIQPSPSAVDEVGPKARSPSGRLLLRMPPRLHAELTRAAEREGASLNGYIISRLAASVGLAPDDDDRLGLASDRPRRERTLVWLLAANVVAVSLASLAAAAIVLVAWLA